MRVVEITNIEHGPLETCFKWKITDFFSVIQDENVRCFKSQRFKFKDLEFQFELCPISHLYDGFMVLSINFWYWFFYVDYSIEYSYGFETQDGSLEMVVRGMVTKKNNKWDRCIFKISEIQERKSDLAPSDVVTFICKLKHNPSSSQAEIPKEPKKLRKLHTLSENLKSLFINKQNCDVTLRLKDKEYKAHSAVLIARSSVFAAMFQQEIFQKNKGMMTRHRRKSQQKESQNMVNIPDSTITITDCDSASFELFLKFLYCGEMEELSSQTALHLYEISNKYNYQELKVFCMEFLIENLTVENFCKSVIIADKYDDSELSTATQNFFYENVDQVLKSSEWDSLVKSNSLLSKKYLTECR